MVQSNGSSASRAATGNLTTVLAGPPVMLNATFTLNRSTAPHVIDYVNLAGPSTGKRQAGSDELPSGLLKICTAGRAWQALSEGVLV